ncbi:hypothetical protein EON82_01655 [bacterium]|nr:MAG: hypothetical protein EON82_01655 [bacterium]
MRSFRTAAIGVCLAITTLGLAKPPFLKVFMEAYKISPNSPLGKAKCLSCHLPPAPPKRSNFGHDVQAAMEAVHARMLSPEILKAVEKKDSDGDGFNNLTEIRAGTLPNDKSSKPAKSRSKSSLLLLGAALLPSTVLCVMRRRRV